MNSRISIVGMACRYPDARSIEELWENVLAQRRAFRRLPDERMRKEDYWSADPEEPDKFYTAKAAVIEGYEFDRMGFKVAGSTYRATDLTHWLALDVAARALADAGFPEGEGLPSESTSVVIGNTLTGEFSRANVMRLRWPYVKRTVAAALQARGWQDDELGAFLVDLEATYKHPFAPVDEDTLAGGLSNTIAGRICNYFDLKGGGYAVDGACCSSLLSVITACNALSAGTVDVAIAGGVDLSIDPFEIIGFAKNGALAPEEMRVYDRRSQGFWPGEGCGMVVLMRERDAIAGGARVYAHLAGWGMSTDGRGGITRPEVDGIRLALNRAYERAGYGLETVGYVEGHGTGTEVGDAVELRALSSARRDSAPDVAAVPLSTIKGNIGHTKAAAGVAGLIKASLAVHHQVIPPATSHVETHPELKGPDARVRVPQVAELWPDGLPIRAAVSSSGFGGINTHLTMEGDSAARRRTIDERTRALVASAQDAELLLIDAANFSELRTRVADLVALVPQVSYSELADLAVALQGQLDGRPVRAAVVASSPEEAERRLARLLEMLSGGVRSMLDGLDGVFLGTAGVEPRIAYLFPGQGSGRQGNGRVALERRFADVAELFDRAGLPADGDHVATDVAQPRIVTGSVAGLRLLSALGIDGHVAVGHSLGELTALHWAGAMDEAAVLRLAGVRGRVMMDASQGGGAMASIVASPERVEALLDGEPVVIAGYNGPLQTVISGPADAVARVGQAAERSGLDQRQIAVSHAFHSPLVAPAAARLAEHLAREAFQPLQRDVSSTVTGEVLATDADLRALLHDQIALPVRFAEAAARAAQDADIVIEVGPGRVLAGLTRDIAPGAPIVSLETDSPSIAPLLRAVGALFALGAPVKHDVLFAGRLARPLPADGKFTFFASPCETAPQVHLPAVAVAAREVAANGAAAAPAQRQEGVDTVELLRRLTAERAELPVDLIRPQSRLLDDLHLSSITVGQIVNQAARELGRTPPAMRGYATASLAELAEVLDDIGAVAPAAEAESEAEIAGVAPWVRAFSVNWIEAAAPEPAAALSGAGTWQVFATGGHPLAEPLRAGLEAGQPGGGVLLCLEPDIDETHVGLLLSAARAALAAGDGGRRLVVAQHGRGASGLAKTLHLEDPKVAVTIVDVPMAEAAQADMVNWVVAEARATAGFAEVHYDAAGVRRVPVLRPLPIPAGRRGDLPLGADDVVLVTGGGKGITAESALELARETKAKLALLGRSDPAADRELAANLDRMSAAGVTFRYVRGDVTSASEVRAAVEDATAALGPITAVLHGAGRNQPTPLASMDEASFQRTVAPKTAGLRAVLDAVDPGQLKLLITFGSIIGRGGLRGEADYATANDWMTALTLDVQREHPGCRCLALEWSVWSGTGMGERLGVVESLLREGIAPIPTDEGTRLLLRLLADPEAPPVLVVSGRVAGLPTLSFEQRELPLLRFLDNPRVHFPGVELIADAVLSSENDPYLDDHTLQEGLRLFPAVLGMEAMAQVGAALTGREDVPVLEGAEFLRPIVVERDAPATVRLAALQRDEATVDVVIRAGETNFQADHFRATLRYPRPSFEGAAVAPNGHGHDARVPLEPKDLYDGVLFQGRRFQRLLGYRRLAGKSCEADISNVAPAPWFGWHLPGRLLLSDPGTRDTFMHAIQCCVPDATLLPQGVRRIELADASAAELSQVTMRAQERQRDGDTYVYDLEVRGPADELIERWQGLSLRAVRKQGGEGPWLPALLGPYLERRMEDLFGELVAVTVAPDGVGAAATREARRERTGLAMSNALGRPAAVRYRPDGKPEVDGDEEVSASHGADVTMAVASPGRTVACDVERAAERTPQEWDDLLDKAQLDLTRLVTRESDESQSVAATRVWSAIEAAHKAGQPFQVPVTLAPRRHEGWVLFESGDMRIATFVTRLHDQEDPAVFAILTTSGND